MDQFDRRGERESRLAPPPDRFRRSQAQNRTDPFPAGEKGISNRLMKQGRLAFGSRNISLKDAIDLGQSLVEIVLQLLPIHEKRFLETFRPLSHRADAPVFGRLCLEPVSRPFSPPLPISSNNLSRDESLPQRPLTTLPRKDLPFQ